MHTERQKAAIAAAFAYVSTTQTMTPPYSPFEFSELRNAVDQLNDTELHELHFMADSLRKVVMHAHRGRRLVARTQETFRPNGSHSDEFYTSLGPLDGAQRTVYATERGYCCWAGLTASPGPCPWHPKSD